jgi:uncharacterized protein (UPF0212 family)
MTEMREIPEAVLNSPASLDFNRIDAGQTFCERCGRPTLL